MKKIMEKIMETLKWTMFIAGIIMTVAIVRPMPAAEKPEWKVVMSGTIVDVDPISNNGASGVFYEMEGAWLWLWEIEGAWPSRGQTGTFYRSGSGDNKKHKWVKDKGSQAPAKKATTKRAVAPQVITKSVSWKSVMIGVPPVDKTVLVRYKNGKTITTAYLNVKKEWKLETDRERISSGRKIETIKEWKEIPL